MQALLIACDQDESAILSVVLQRAGLTHERANSLEAVLEAHPPKPADMLIIAGTTPVAELHAQIRRLRAQTEAPLLLITEKLTEDDQVLLLKAGVDLLVERPFSARLLIAQTQALLRRTAGVHFFSLPTLTIAGLTLNPATRTVQVLGGEEQRLTQLEFRLLYTLMVHRGQILPAEVLVEHVWGYAGEGDRNLVRGLMSRLRAKIEPQPKTPRYVVTIPGVGYQFTPLE